MFELSSTWYDCFFKWTLLLVKHFTVFLAIGCIVLHTLMVIRIKGLFDKRQRVGNGMTLLLEMTTISYCINFCLTRVWPFFKMQQPFWYSNREFFQKCPHSLISPSTAALCFIYLWKSFVFFFSPLSFPPWLPHSLLHFRQQLHSLELELR